MHEVAALIVTRIKKKKTSISNGDIKIPPKRSYVLYWRYYITVKVLIMGLKSGFEQKRTKICLCSVSEFGCTDPVGTVGDHFPGCILCSDASCGLDPDVGTDVVLHENDVFDLGACAAKAR